MRHKRFAPHLIAVIPLLLLLGLAGFYLYQQAFNTYDNLARLVMGEIEKNFQHEVRIEKFTTTWGGQAIATNVDFANGPTFKSGVMMHADRVVLKMDLLGLMMHRRTVASCLQSVDVYGGSGLVQRLSAKKWNVQSLIRPRPKGKPPGPPFTAIVRVHDASVRLEDYAASEPRSPAVTLLRSVNGYLDAADFPAIRFDLGAQSASPTLRTARFAGSYDTVGKVWRLQLQGSGAKLAYWSTYLSKTPGLQVKAGIGEMALSIYRQNALPGKMPMWFFDGVAKIKGGGAVLCNSLVIGNANAVAQFSRDTVTLNGTGNVGRLNAGALVPARVSGTLHNLGHDTQAMLSAATPSSDIGRMLRAGGIHLPSSVPPPSGTGVLAAQIQGGIANPKVAYTLSGPRLNLMNYAFRNYILKGTYSDGLLELRQGTAVAFNSPLTAAGTADLKKSVVNLHAQLGVVDLASLNVFGGAHIKGKAETIVKIAGPFSSPGVVITARSPAVVVNGATMKNVYAAGQLVGSGVQVSSFSAAGFGGRVSGSGFVGHGGLDLDFRLNGVNIASLGKFFGVRDVSGYAYARGHLSGSPSTPQVTAKVQMFEGAVQGVGYNLAQGTVGYQKQRITFDHFKIDRYPSQMIADGSVDLAHGEPRFALKVDLKQVRISQIARQLSKYMTVPGESSGVVSGVVTAQGPLSALHVAADVSSKTAVIGGVSLDDLRLRVGYSDAVLSVQEASAKIGGGSVDATGTLGVTGNQLQIKLDQLPLERAAAWLPPGVRPAGYLNGSFNASGELSSPHIDGTIKGVQLMLGGRAWDHLTASVTYDGNLTIKDFELAAAPPEKDVFRVSQLVYSKDKGLTTLEGELKDLDMAALLRVARQITSGGLERFAQVNQVLAGLPQPMEGIVNAKFNLGQDSPDSVESEVKVSGLQLGPVNFDTVSGHLEGAGNQLKLTKVLAQKGPARLEGDLALSALGDINAHININEFDLTQLASLGLNELPLTGKLTAEAVISGTVTDPNILMTATATKGSYHGITFDKLATGPVTWTADQITADELLLQRGDLAITGNLKLPWSLHKLQVPSDLPLNAHFNLTKNDLKALALVIPEVDVKRTTGPLIANITVGGILRQPIVTGQFSTTNAALAFNGVGTIFQNLNIDLQFDSTQMIVKTFQAKASTGGSLEGSGALNLFANGADQSEIKLAFKQLKLEARNLTEALKIGGNAVTTGTLVAQGSLAQPKVTGALSVAEADVSIPGLTATEPVALPVPIIDPHFDILVTLGDKVWLHNPRFRLQAKGPVTVTGALSSPTIAAHLTVERGNLLFPTARFRITQIGSVDLLYHPPFESRFVLDITAQTSITLQTASSIQGPIRQTGQHYTITVYAKGPLDKLDIRFRSDPPGLNTQQVYAMLGHTSGLDSLIHGSSSSGFRDEFASVFSASVAPLLVEPIESALERAFNLEEFSVEGGFMQPVRVTKRLFSKVYVTYWRTFTASDANMEYLIKLSYRLSNRLELSYRTDERHINAVEIEGVLPF